MKINYSSPFSVWFLINEKGLLLIVRVDLGFPFPRAQLLLLLLLFLEVDGNSEALFLKLPRAIKEPDQLMGVKSQDVSNETTSYVLSGAQ